jgi:hypothetical protein
MFAAAESTDDSNSGGDSGDKGDTKKPKKKKEIKTDTMTIVPTPINKETLNKVFEWFMFDPLQS